MLLFSYIYAISIVGVPLGTAKLAIIACIFILLVYGHYKRPARMFLYSLSKYYFTQILLLVYTLFIVTIMSSQDNNLIYSLTLRLTEFILGSFLIVYIGIFVFRFKLDHLLLLISLVILLQTLFIFVSFISFDFKLFTAAVLPATGNIDSLRLNRVRGFSNSSGATLSLVQAIGAFSAFYLALFRYRKLKAYVLVVMGLAILSSVVVVGRTGLVSGFLMTVIFLILITCYKSKFALKLPVVLSVGMLSMSLISVFTFNYFLSEEIKELFLNKVLPWAFEFFTSGAEGKIGTHSTSQLREMLFLPDTLKTIFFGDGFFQTETGNYMKTDSGYVRMIFAIGIIGSTLLYLPLLLLVVKAVKCSPSFYYQAFLISLVTVMALNEIKEPFLLKPQIYPLILMLLLAPIFQRKSCAT